MSNSGVLCLKMYQIRLNARIAGTSGKAGRKARGFAVRNAKKVLKNPLNDRGLPKNLY